MIFQRYAGNVSTDWGVSHRYGTSSVVCVKFIANATILADTITALATSGSGSGTARWCIYDHDSVNDRPGNLLGTTEEFTITSTRKYYPALLDTPVTIIAGTTYWMGALAATSDAMPNWYGFEPDVKGTQVDYEYPPPDPYGVPDFDNVDMPTLSYQLKDTRKYKRGVPLPLSNTLLPHKFGNTVLDYSWSTNTSSPAPVGYIEANNASLSAATEIYVEYTTGGLDVALYLLTLVGETFTLHSKVDNDFATYAISSYDGITSTTVEFSVTYLGGTGSFANDEAIIFHCLKMKE